MPIEIFLRDAVSLLAASIAVLLVCNRFRIPSIVGFLLTGLLIGPSGLRLVARTEQVELFAEIGVSSCSSRSASSSPWSACARSGASSSSAASCRRG